LAMMNKWGLTGWPLKNAHGTTQQK
jgi:hypothetical protein